MSFVLFYGFFVRESVLRTKGTDVETKRTKLRTDLGQRGQSSRFLGSSNSKIVYYAYLRILNPAGPTSMHLNQ